MTCQKPGIAGCRLFLLPLVIDHNSNGAMIEDQLSRRTIMAMFQRLCILGALTDSADEVKVSEKASSITVQSCVVLKELQNVKVGGLYIR